MDWYQRELQTERGQVGGLVGRQSECETERKGGREKERGRTLTNTHTPRNW
jgi:hypothetical protein